MQFATKMSIISFIIEITWKINDGDKLTNKKLIINTSKSSLEVLLPTLANDKISINKYNPEKHSYLLNNKLLHNNGPIKFDMRL